MMRFGDNFVAVGMGILAVSYPSGTEGNEAFEGSMGFTFEGKSSSIFKEIPHSHSNQLLA
jgi:hypothetical protein